MEQADTSNTIKDWNKKGEYVYSRLKEVADRTQPPVVALLARQKCTGNVLTYKRYIISNALGVTGNQSSVNALATSPAVANIDVFPLIELTDQPLGGEPTATPCPRCRYYPPSSPEWNVSVVRAPQAWAMGYTGAGVTIGSIDSGAFYQHEAIVGKYRGNLGGGNFNHNYNWWDATSGTPIPYDSSNVGHGTHTIGTLVGDYGIGIAPGAQWISAGFTSQPNYNVEPDIIEAMEFMLCPWDLNRSNPDCNLRPQVVSNSWTSIAPDACAIGDNHPFLTWINNWRNAGIFPSFSAGNTITTNSIPAAYPESFETGSVNSNNVRSQFSSVGPSCINRGDRQLPQIVAGGGDIGCPSTYGVLSAGRVVGEYCYISGTSQAQPATAGAVAIIRQANPNLGVSEIEDILRETAAWYPSYETSVNPATGQPCGSRPNPCYGYGLLNIEAAVQAALPPPPPRPTRTPTRTSTPTLTPTNTPTPTPCPQPGECGQFADVARNYEFYPYIQCLACRGIVGGYSCGGPGEPCQCASLPYFRPSANVTRGQISQMTSKAAGFTEPAGPQIFEDVPPSNDFYEAVNRLANRGILGGYPCTPGGAVEPCVPPANRPYFRPNAPSTRGQIAKIVSGAAGYNEEPPSQTFEDVPVGSEFYKPIERLAARGIVGGYPCGSSAVEPCVPPANRPYFRPGNNATRGQSAKIVSRTFYPVCNPVGAPGAPGGKPAIPTTATIQATPNLTPPPATNTPVGTPTITPPGMPSPWPTVPLPIPTGVYLPTIPPVSTVPGTIPVSSPAPTGTASLP